MIKKIPQKNPDFQADYVRKNNLGWFEMNEDGRFRIVVKHNNELYRSFPAFYQGIASLTVDGISYIGVSSYFQGALPHEQVIRINT